MPVTERMQMAEEQTQHTPSTQISPPASDVSTRTMTAEESKQELREAIKGSNQILASATTTLALFPDTMIIDRAKVTITKRSFFRVADVMSIRVEDVLNAVCSVGPFLGTVTVVSRVLSSDQTTTIGRFWRADAKRLKRVLQGYIIAPAAQYRPAAIWVPRS
ncbi:MAG: hypothetical protein WDN27_05650 [Candidatus Saccharibacteria bacterium]